MHNLLNTKIKPLSLSNPISKEMSVMRSSLWPGLLNTILYNQNRQQEQLRFFESGLCFFYDISSELQVNQEFFLAGAISGFINERTWNLSRRKVDFYDLKGDLESVLELYADLTTVEFNPKIFSELHSGQSAEILMNNRYIGKIGALHPVITKQLNFKYKVFLFELSLKNFKDKDIKRIQMPSNFPSSRRDISIILPIEVTFKQVLIECRKIFPDKISKIDVFDVYSGNNLVKGKRSLAISFLFQHSRKTLNEDYIDKILKTCIKQLEDCFSATLRN